MDDPALARAELEYALRGLRRLNAASLAPWLMRRAVEREAAGIGRPLRVLDVACACGDWVIACARRFGAERIEWSGCDVNGTAVEMARGASGSLPVKFFVHDAVRAELPGGFDVVVCSLFLHHLREEDARRVMGHMAAASRRAVIVNDLVRSRAALTAVACASRALSGSRVVHTDAVRSVRAAYTREELVELCRGVGLRGVRCEFGGFGRVLVCGRVPA
jgi:SAM-dependent methyltransferase